MFNIMTVLTSVVYQKHTHEALHAAEAERECILKVLYLKHLGLGSTGTILDAQNSVQLFSS